MAVPDRPRVTVVVPARNEENAVVACLDSVAQQTERSLQIIVVDGDSDDDTAQVVRRYAERDPRVQLLHNPRRTVPYAMNVALAAAEADTLVRIDAHATVPPGYVARAAELLETGRYGAVGGVKLGVGRTPAGKAIAVAMASRLGVGGSVYHYGTTPQEVDHVPFGAYPVALARELGGWGEQFTVNQDFEFDYRVRQAGHSILFDPSLVIEWECRQSVRDLFKQYRRYGKGKVKVALAHPDSIRPRHLLPPLLVLGLGSLSLAAISRRLRTPALLAMASYGAAIVGGSVTTAPRVSDPRARGYLPGAFLAMHIGWGIGAWEGLAAEARRRRS